MKKKLYEMVMEFDITAGLKELNSFTEMFGFNEKIGIPGQTVRLTQTLPFIPDEEYIHKVEKILKDKYEIEKYNILDCHFRGYQKLIEKEVEVPEPEAYSSFDIELD